MTEADIRKDAEEALVAAILGLYLNTPRDRIHVNAFWDIISALGPHFGIDVKQADDADKLMEHVKRLRPDVLRCLVIG